VINPEAAKYIQMSDREMDAAHRAKRVDQCVMHLDRARRYALLACRERQLRSNWIAARQSTPSELLLARRCGEGGLSDPHQL
jgi:hypothetical protein